MEDLNPGAELPVFDLPATGGGTLANADLSGKWAVLFFYPRDDTSGCTREATEFTARLDEFTAAGASVCGISKDSLKSHEKFVAKHGLGMRLLSDEHGDLCERTGCWKEKSMYGKTYLGIERTTLLVDPSGIVRQIWRKVKVPGHVEEVLATLRSMA